MKEIYYKNKYHFLNQKFASSFKNSVNEHSLLQIDNLIKEFDKNYLSNIRKEMVVNLLKYNVDGDWVWRLKESEKYKRASCSLDACIIRYGDVVGKKIYGENIEKVKSKKENYTAEEWKVICDSKKSNLGLDGYIQKYGEVDGNKRWDAYLLKWRDGIKKRKESGVWKNGRSLAEFQEKWGICEGYKKWRAGYDKRNYTLSLKGFIDRFGIESGTEKYYKHIAKMISNCRGGHCRKGYSNISQRLFDDLLEIISPAQRKDVKYFTHNEEESFYACGKYGLNLIYVDFKCGHAIIEFDGDYWHSFPAMIDRDGRRDLFLRSIGYNILRVKECDYNNNKQETVDKCIEFIAENYERA